MIPKLDFQWWPFALSAEGDVMTSDPRSSDTLGPIEPPPRAIEPPPRAIEPPPRAPPS